MKPQALLLAALSCASISLANPPEQAQPQAASAGNSCGESFEAVKGTRTRNAAATRTYANVQSRLSALGQIPEGERSGEKYEAQLKACNLAVELLKAQLETAALNKKYADSKKEISSVQDSIISLQDGILTELKVPLGE